MAIDIRSKHLSFYLRIPEGEWDVFSLPGGQSCLEQVRMSCRGRAGRSPFVWSGDMPQARVVAAAAPASLEGEAQSCGLAWRDPASGLRFRLEVHLPESAPLMLWRLAVENSTPADVELDRIDMLAVGPARGDPRQSRRGWWTRSRTRLSAPGGIRVAASPGALRFFSHGWQSWSFTGTIGEGDRFPHSRLGPIMIPKHWNPGTPHPAGPGHAVSDMYGVLADTHHRLGILAGSLSQAQAFTSLEARLDRYAPTLTMWQNLDGVVVAPGDTFVSDWAAILFFGLDDPEPAHVYFDAVARESHARPALEPPVGWCSWYQFFDRLCVEDISRNLAWIEAHRDDLTLSTFLVDDGFEPRVGDWHLRREEFPSSLRELSDRIRSIGSGPGLWLAPFVAHPRSELARGHPNWLLRTRLGWPAHVGFAWNTFARALDVSRPEVVQFTADLVHQACHEWGFELVKLDFLYAGALAGRRFDRRVTRAQALRRALSAIREAAGDSAVLVGCGCPVGSGVGIFDVMRIGADVAPAWQPAFHGIAFPFRDEPEMPSVRNALRNAVTRAPLHRRWWVNDPDCLLLREAGSRRSAVTGPSAAGQGVASELSEEEARTLATVVAMTGGSILDSDDLPALTPGRLAWLRRILPPMPGRPRVLDLWDAQSPQLLCRDLTGATGTWWLLAVINWEDGTRRCEVDLARHGIRAERGLHCVDFWGETYRHLSPGDPLQVDLPGHGAVAVALRPDMSGAQWLGDTFHISQGLVVQEWRPGARGFRARLNSSIHAGGRAWVRLEQVPSHAGLDGTELASREVGHGVWRFDLPPHAQATFTVEGQVE